MNRSFVWFAGLFQAVTLTPSDPSPARRCGREFVRSSAGSARARRCASARRIRAPQREASADPPERPQHRRQLGAAQRAEHRHRAPRRGRCHRQRHDRAGRAEDARANGAADHQRQGFTAAEGGDHRRRNELMCIQLDTHEGITTREMATSRQALALTRDPA
jgi:hypothetical protein